MARLRGDPTRTTMLRNRFRLEMRKRFRAIRRLVIELVVELDAFGLNEPVGRFSLNYRPFATNQMTSVGVVQNVEPQEWRFQTDPQKTASFRAWLQEQVDNEVLQTDAVTGQPWTGEFVESAYRKGMSRAFGDARGAAAQENLAFFEGTREEFLRQAFSSPETLSKVELLATRSFEELRGVTAVQAQRLNRILASGLAAGQNPREIARAMVQQIDGLSKTRAEVIARTEIINAHSEGQLDAFARLGVEGVGVLAEFATAGDDRVCPSCSELEGETFTLQEARGVIPVHPNCRCAWIPAVGDDDEPG